MDKIFTLSVVRDYAMYEKCLASNAFVADTERVVFDNRAKNEPIPVLYNRFLDGYDSTRPAWFVFCHEDFQPLESFAPLLARADPNAVWGPVGARIVWRWGVNPRLTICGQLQESSKTGEGLRTLGTEVNFGASAETLDCLCIIVHSSLVARLNLRFDVRFAFDLYAEDVCVAASQAGCDVRILPMACRHWSTGELGKRYRETARVFADKWPTVCVTGTSSDILGGGAGAYRRAMLGLKRLRRTLGASVALKGMGWSFAGQVLVKAVQFGFSIVLARLLCPADFGLVGMIAIFLAFCEIFSDCGFDAALMRKQDRREVDYDTVFWFKTGVAVLGYAVLFSAAPFIAGFYREPQLTHVTRVAAFGFVIASMASVAFLRLRVALRFRTMALLSFVAVLLSGFVGLVCAWKGLGVWAVVGQGLSWQATNLVLQYGAARWVPSFRFSRKSFGEFFDFGWKHLVRGLVNVVYGNGYSAVIGRSFGAGDLGLYNRADYYTAEVGSVVGTVVNDVNYPLLAKLQNDAVELRRAYRRLQILTASVMLPGMAFLAVFAEPIIRLVIGEQWLPCVPYLRMLALGAAFRPLVNLTYLPMYLRGRVDLALKLELIEKPLAFVLLLVALPLGVFAICAAKSVSTVVFFILNSVVLLRWRGRC